jgi:hypothetical protein
MLTFLTKFIAERNKTIQKGNINKQALRPKGQKNDDIKKTSL